LAFGIFESIGDIVQQQTTGSLEMRNHMVKESSHCVAGSLAVVLVGMLVNVDQPP